MLTSPVTPLIQAQTPAPAAPKAPRRRPPHDESRDARTAPVAVPGLGPDRDGRVPRPTAPADGGWPRAYATPSGGKILVYQPQVAEWTDQKHMVAYAAVSWQARTAAKPTLGSLKLEADTKVATAERLVKFSTLKITEANFPQVQKEQVRELTDEITRSIPDHERIIGLDRVLASVDTSKIIPARSRASEGRSAGDFLQRDASRADEPRRRADLVADCQQRPEVRGQHQLGPVPARARARPTTSATTRAG